MRDLRIENWEPTSIDTSLKPKKEVSKSFAETIKGAVNDVNTLQKQADKSILDLLEGKTEVHETMIALQKADISMRFLLTVRNKVIEAYREIMHMQM